MKILRSKKLMGLCCSVLLLASCSASVDTPSTQSGQNPSPSDGTITIWWTRSFYIQEDEALEAAIAQWEKETGHTAELFFFDEDDLPGKIANALKRNAPPEIVFSPRIAFTSVPLWAWEGKLADVSSVVEPLKEQYSSSAIEAVSLYNQKSQKRSIYATPIGQRTIHIHYWRDLLAEAGLNEADIPQEWEAFWNFWKQAQDNLRAKGYTDIYCCGFPMSAEATDTHFIFEQILEAYDIPIVDEEGNLIDNQEIRQQVARAMEFFASFYREGYVSPDADNWTNGSNNKAFLNQNVLMTINPTLSIPNAQKEDEEIYQERIVTIGFPQEPDGEIPRYVVTLKQVALFESSPNPEIAKDFLSYFIEPEHLEPYLENSLGRYFPVMPELAAKPFWNDPADPHVFAATQQFQRGETIPSAQSLNPAYSTLQSENIWGLAIEGMVAEGKSGEEATEEAFSRIREIFREWER